MKKMLTVGMISGLLLMTGCQSNDVEPVEDNNETIEQIEIPTIGETSETKEENNSSLEADVNKILSNYLQKEIVNGNPDCYVNYDTSYEQDVVEFFSLDSRRYDRMLNSGFISIYIEDTLINGAFDLIEDVKEVYEESGEEFVLHYVEQGPTEKETFTIVYNSNSADEISVMGDEELLEEKYGIIVLDYDKVEKFVRDAQEEMNSQPIDNDDFDDAHTPEDNTTVEDSDSTVEGWDESWSQHEYCTDANGNVDYCSSIETEEDNTAEDYRTSDWENYGFRYWTDVVEFDRSGSSMVDFDWKTDMFYIGESAMGYELVMFTYDDGCVMVNNNGTEDYFFITLEEADNWRY